MNIAAAVGINEAIAVSVQNGALLREKAPMKRARQTGAEHTE